MPTELRVVLEDRPGTLAHLAGVLGDARVNSEAIQGTSQQGKSVMDSLLVTLKALAPS